MHRHKQPQEECYRRLTQDAKEREEKRKELEREKLEAEE